MTGRQIAGAAAATAATAILAVQFFYAVSNTSRSTRENSCRALMPDPLYSALQGKPAPDFQLPDASGKQWSLQGLRGKPVLVSYWATWCPPCVDEMPSLEQLARRLGDRAAVLAVSVDSDWAPIKQFFPKGTPLTVLLDPTGDVPASYGTSKFPETFLIGRGGQVKQLFISERNWAIPEAVECVLAAD